jgi:hypothetical protein
MLNVERSADAHAARVALMDSEAKHNRARAAWRESIARLGETMAQLDERDALIEAFDRAAMAIAGCTAAQLVKQLQVPANGVPMFADGTDPIDRDIVDPMDWEDEAPTGREVSLPMIDMMGIRR